MCGIAAKTGAGGFSESALDTLSKRGPDDRGFLQFINATLGHTRLSIIDLTHGGHQPMEDKNQGTAIVFNGEIYNYRELRKTLEQKGRHFRTESDTEVILKAYAEYGEHCPEHLDGMFAFAIWDEKKQALFMARDRFGKKPLYYSLDPQGNLTIASEIKALVAMGVTPELDPAGIDAYLTLMYVPPWRTVYKNVHTLLPAHRAIFKDKNLKIVKYWELPQKPLTISYEEAKEELRRLFDSAVKKRMVADVEVGALLSGGVDSTIVTAYAQKHASHPIKTFSLGYGEHINELPFAKEAAEKIGTNHHTLEASSDLVEELERVLAYFDEPHGDSADFPQHMVSELASQKVKVALAGDGGDELFLGYGWYFSYWNSRKLTRIKNLLTSNPYTEHLRNATVFPARLRHQLWKEVPHSESIEKLVTDSRLTGIQKMNLFDIMTYLPGQLLTKVDRMSMMHSLEVRCPFLDHTLAEFAFNLPEAYKTDRHTGKIILKDLLAETMPREFVDRKKQGFGAPVRKWLKEEKMKTYLHTKLGKGARVYEFLREDAVRFLIERTYRSQHPKAFYQLWVLLCLEVWLRTRTL